MRRRAGDRVVTAQRFTHSELGSVLIIREAFVRAKLPTGNIDTVLGEMIMLKNEKDSEIRAIGPIVVGVRPQAKYDRLIAMAKEVSAATTIVVYPCDETSLRGPIEAAEAGIIVPILVGPAAKIAAVARALRLNIDGFEIVDVPDSESAAAKAVELIHESKG